MNAFYDVTIFLAIGLLAIVVAIFVFGGSLLGRAMQQAADEEKKAAIEREKQLNQNIEELKAKLSGMASGDATTLIDEIETSRDKLRRSLSVAEKERKRIQARPRLLTVGGSVAFPGGLFLLSIFLATAAKIPDWWLSYLLWGVSLVFLGWGCQRIYRSLKIIESVAVTGEEAYLKSTTEAVKAALEEHEESKQPRLELQFTNKKPPFTFKVGSEEQIPFRVLLTQGVVAEYAAVHFFAPAGFDFPQAKSKWPQPLDFETLPNALTTNIEWIRIVPGISPKRQITIKAPSNPGDYKLIYMLTCVGFAGPYEEMQVKVE